MFSDVTEIPDRRGGRTAQLRAMLQQMVPGDKKQAAYSSYLHATRDRNLIYHIYTGYQQGQIPEFAKGKVYETSIREEDGVVNLYVTCLAAPARQETAEQLLHLKILAICQQRTFSGKELRGILGDTSIHAFSELGDKAMVHKSFELTAYVLKTNYEDCYQIVEIVTNTIAYKVIYDRLVGIGV